MAAALVGVPACSSSESCGAIGVYPLSVNVIDATTHAQVCNATVTFDTTGYHQVFTACPYEGGSGAGVYQVTVESPGYDGQQLSVTVPRDDDDSCQQGHRAVTVELTPQSA